MSEKSIYQVTNLTKSHVYHPRFCLDYISTVIRLPVPGPFIGHAFVGYFTVGFSISAMESLWSGEGLIRGRGGAVLGVGG